MFDERDIRLYYFFLDCVIRKEMSKESYEKSPT